MVVGPVLSYVRWSFVVILGCHVALRTYELVTANQQLRMYATQAEDLAAANERNRMAREIHDGLGHYFTSINAQIAAAQVLLEVNRPRALAALATAQRLTDEGLADVRRSVTALREPTTRPLPEILERLVQNACAAGVVTRLHVEGTPRTLPPQVHEALYRVVQEGLNNVRKHAQATRTDVVLAYQASTSVCLVIQDNGTGTSETRRGHGLAIMQERIQTVGGTLRTWSAPGQGFRIEVEVPG
jgi:signal transduction histidine kinase